MVRIIVPNGEIQAMKIETLDSGIELTTVPAGSYFIEVRESVGGEILVIEIGDQKVGCGKKGWENQGAQFISL
jgi:hypothetical protein